MFCVVLQEIFVHFVYDTVSIRLTTTRINLREYIPILCHAWIIPKQNASKIVKISQQMAKLWRKLKWLVFFWDTVYRPMSLVTENIRYMRILAGVPLGGGLKWEWGGWRRQFLAIWVATSSETSEIRPAISYDDILPLVMWPSLLISSAWQSPGPRPKSRT